MAVGFAGLLLIVPGMITDVIAVVVVIGPLRRGLARWLFPPRAEPYVPERDSTEHHTLEGDFRRIDD